MRFFFLFSAKEAQHISKQSVTQGLSDMQKPSKTNQNFPKTGENKPILKILITLFSGTLLVLIVLMRHFQIREHDTKKDDIT